MSRRRSFRQALNRAVAERRLLVVPDAYDALSALLIERTGFDTMFIGGFPVAGARYGVPDIGLKGFGDIAAAVRDILAACDVPVLVDIDDGYGDVKKRRAHRSNLRADGRERGLSRGPGMAQALRSYGRQESRAGGNHGGQDQGHDGGAA